MKFVKRISYFFVIPVVFLILGIFLGVWGIHFFYPGQWQDLNENRLALPLTEEEALIEIDLLGHDFFAYIDRDTSAVHILYRRSNGGYGLLKHQA